MKKVLYITTLSRTINAFLIPHIEMLIKEGYKVDCACCIDKEVDSKLGELGVEVFDITFSRNPFNIKNIKAYSELIKIQKRNNYDIVHVHTPVAALYGRLLKLIFKNLKTIYTAHGYHFYKGAPLINWLLYYPLERIMSHFTDVNITINQEDYERSKTFHCKDTYLINGVGLDLEEYTILDEAIVSEKRTELGLDKDDFVIIMIAELNKNKNQKQLIEAMKLLKDKYPNIKALCVGEGGERKNLEELISKYKLQDNIKLLGFRTDINELVNISDIGVLLSYREGLPRNIMELMACGKPVIGTNIRGNKDLIKDNINGFLIEVNESDGLAKALKKVYKSTEIRKKFKLNNIEFIKNYSIENILKSIEVVYYK